MKRIYIALENVRSLHNIGAVLRTCSFFGFAEVLLVGFSGKLRTPGGKVLLNPKLEKTALGSESKLNLTFLDSSKDLVEFASENNLKIISVEQNEKSIKLEVWQPENDSVLVFGNEREGVSSQVLEHSREIVEISRYGKHNSLNVSTAAGIVLHWIRSRM